MKTSFTLAIVLSCPLSCPTGLVSRSAAAAAATAAAAADNDDDHDDGIVTCMPLTSPFNIFGRWLLLFVSLLH